MNWDNHGALEGGVAIGFTFHLHACTPIPTPRHNGSKKKASASTDTIHLTALFEVGSLFKDFTEPLKLDLLTCMKITRRIRRSNVGVETRRQGSRDDERRNILLESISIHT